MVTKKKAAKKKATKKKVTKKKAVKKKAKKKVLKNKIWGHLTGLSDLDLKFLEKEWKPIKPNLSLNFGPGDFLGIWGGPKLRLRLGFIGFLSFSRNFRSRSDNPVR